MKLDYLLCALCLIFCLQGCEDDGTSITCTVPDNTCEVRTPSYSEIPNLSFDDWNHVDLGNYDIPKPTNFWVTSNEAIAFYQGGATAEKVSGDEAFEGQGSAAKLITRATVSPADQIFPVAGGSIATGVFTAELSDPLSSLKFGRPFNNRITSISGYYKYMPVDGDSCGLYAFMRKCRDVTDECGNTYGVSDTIGWARFSTANSIMEYTGFQLDLTYTSNETPDEVVIYFASSDDADDGNGGIGSTLYIDELSVVYE